MKKLVMAALLGTLPSLASAEFMDAEWAAAACEAWNANDALTTELAEKWMQNNGERGYKLVRMYRTECGEETQVQMTIAEQDGKAMCVYGGAPDDKAFNKKMDYQMHATDEHWTCIGAAHFGCGAMGAMMSGKLKFTGPKMEAMGVMKPFGEFLKLTGSLGGDKTPCQ
ncbi:MAG: SCP2 sterol-binding domain-containing protein [Gammaproteobacteria bacterium]|nr:SCP2 sterol-binding domain-containing protein [Gammaproteobacteria bacterium]